LTDLEAHVNAEGRDKLVKQVREKIDELGVTYIYYQFMSKPMACEYSMTFMKVGRNSSNWSM